MDMGQGPLLDMLFGEARWESGSFQLALVIKLSPTFSPFNPTEND